jgi:hypothetical protein
MKTRENQSKEIPKEELIGVKTISLERAKQIMNEEGVEYTDDELNEILDFISKAISIATSHYERVKQKETKVISINTSTHETKSIPLHPGKYGRAS